MKKMIMVAMAVSLVASLGFAKSAKKAKKAAKIKIQLITMDQMDQYWANIDKGCKKAAEELGNVTYRWNAPTVKDDAQQIECINNAIAQGVDAILLAANGPDAVTSALKAASKEGVKIIYVDSPANYPAVATLGTDNTAAGKTAGEQMLKALQEKGIAKGNIGVISVNSATASTVARETGFRSAFAGTEFKILETQYCDGDTSRSKDAAANFITQGVVGLFGANEGSTVGIGNAIHESGSKAVGVGFDNSDMIQQLIKQSYLLCTMSQNPDVMGYEGIKIAVDAVQGKKIANTNIDTGVSVLGK